MCRCGTRRARPAGPRRTGRARNPFGHKHLRTQSLGLPRWPLPCSPRAWILDCRSCPANTGSPSKRPARRGKHWSSGWYALAVALLLVATGAVAPHAQGRGGPGPHRRADRADRQLAERLNQGDGSDRERVIITLKPGAKRRLLQELQANGERADHGLRRHRGRGGAPAAPHAAAVAESPRRGGDVGRRRRELR